MKRTLALILVLTMVLVPVLLVSCNEPDEPEETTTAKADDTTAEPSDTTAEDTTADTTADDTTAEVTTAPVIEDGPRDKSKTYRVLFIGNSFTHYNDMHKPTGIFYKIATAAGYKVVVDYVTKGGWYLNQMIDPTDQCGKQVHAKLKSSVKYDVVIVQEQSGNPIKDPGDFYDSVREMKKLVDGNGAEMWLYETWGYKAGHSSLPNFGTAQNGLTATAEMEMKLRAAYAAIGKELGVPVVYAGTAMNEVYAKYGSKAEVYHTDSKHPSVIGSTLIAFTLFDRIFGVDAQTIDYKVGLTDEQAAILKEEAHNAAKGDAPVLDAYKTTSEGVNWNTSGKVRKVNGVVDATKTKMLTTAPAYAKMISVIYRDSKTTGSGWMTYKKDATKTFSGIRGDKDAIASPAYSATKLTDAQKKDIADIGYGVSVIGIEYMDDSKKGTTVSTTAGNMTSVSNLVNGHWGSSYMAAMFFDANNYNVKGETGTRGADFPYTALITLNFGKAMNFESIGYFSGSTEGFAQAQDVYVSDDGVNWTKVESACYDVEDTTLASVDVTNLTDQWNNNKATVGVFFSMANTSGKYIRIGIIDGGAVSSNTTNFMEINTREIAVFGSEKN